MTLICLALIIGILLVLFLLAKVFFLVKRILWKRRNAGLYSVGFFHPYCDAGGGGERVLWCAIRAVQNRYRNAHCVVYTGDSPPWGAILRKAESHFNIKLPRPVEFVHLRWRPLVEAHHYPRLTLLLQSLASCVLGLEAALRHPPDAYLDTAGYAWTFPIFRHLCSSRVGAYVHYPTVSSDMLTSVSQRKVTVNNKESISRSRWLSSLKVYYYRAFALVYGWMGRRSDVAMVNSSWTRGHVAGLWGRPVSVVYPPCDVSAFEALPLRAGLSREQGLRAVSIAQFRPEKDHELQLRALGVFLERVPSARDHVTLVLVGGCRHEEDYQRVEGLRTSAARLGLTDCVEFRVNATFGEVLEEMRGADVALHSMWNEHFGIGIVECMSAGLITIAHDSGGPKLDIVEHGRTGFLASDAEGYADALESVCTMEPERLLAMRQAARESAGRFSVRKFEEAFLEAVRPLFV